MQVEPCCWMTYTVHRDTQSTLAILDNLDLDAVQSDEELARKFGIEEEYKAGKLTQWQKVKPKIWLLFDEPASSLAAKVSAKVFSSTIFGAILFLSLHRFHETKIETSGILFF